MVKLKKEGREKGNEGLREVKGEGQLSEGEKKKEKEGKKCGESQ